MVKQQQMVEKLTNMSGGNSATNRSTISGVNSPNARAQKLKAKQERVARIKAQKEFRALNKSENKTEKRSRKPRDGESRDHSRQSKRDKRKRSKLII